MGHLSAILNGQYYHQGSLIFLSPSLVLPQITLYDRSTWPSHSLDRDSDHASRTCHARVDTTAWHLPSCISSRHVDLSKLLPQLIYHHFPSRAGQFVSTLADLGGGNTSAGTSASQSTGGGVGVRK